MEFIASTLGTVGVELELQLLNKRTLDLADGILPLIELYPDSPYVKPEFTQNTVEIASKICNRTDEVEAHMTDLGRELIQNCASLNMDICGSGSHPFSQRLGIITPMPRYLELEQQAGYLGHTQITFATHVHVGMTNGDDTLRVMRALKSYLPLLIALSANSPFWRGYNTGFVAYRQVILSATRSYGIPPVFRSWQEFSDFFEATRRAEIFNTINDIHWDIRPRPHLGTVEVRVMDAQSTIANAMKLAAFVRVLVLYLFENDQDVSPLLEQAPYWWMEKDNHHQASRLGFDANFTYNKRGDTRPLIEIWKDVYATLRTFANDLGEADYLDRLNDQVTIRQHPYARQLALYNAQQPKLLVKALVDMLEKEIGSQTCDR